MTKFISIKVLATLIFATTGLVSASHASTECPRRQDAIRINLTGDILAHQRLFEISTQHPRRFQVLWDQLNPTLKNSDLTIGNLEGPVAPGIAAGGRRVRDVGFVVDGEVYSGTKMVFNYHPYLLDDLRSSGFGLVTTANNHALDRSAIGIDLTLENLKHSKLLSVGTRPQASTEEFIRILEIKGIRIAAISCTEMLNGRTDHENQVLNCNANDVESLIAKNQNNVDLVVVFPHWGDEYQDQPAPRQKQMARRWVAAGARLIVGNHPHVLQSTQWLKTTQGEEALVLYSLGNFIAHQGGLNASTSAVVSVDIKKSVGDQSDKSIIEFVGYSYTPFWRPPEKASLAITSENGQYAEAYQHARHQLGASRCR